MYTRIKQTQMKILSITFLSLLALCMSINTSVGQTTALVQEEVSTSETFTVKVKGVTCGNDLKTIAANVEKLEGVAQCKPGKKGATSTFEVTMNPNLVCQEEIYAAIENTGGCKNPNDRPYKVKQ